VLSASRRDRDAISSTSAYRDSLPCPHRDRDTKGTEVKANGCQLAALKASVLMQKDITTAEARDGGKQRHSEETLRSSK